MTPPMNNNTPDSRRSTLNRRPAAPGSAKVKSPKHPDEYWLFPLPRPRRPNLFYRSLAEALRSRPSARSW
jgi:hypothetical protein